MQQFGLVLFCTKPEGGFALDVSKGIVLPMHASNAAS